MPHEGFGAGLHIHRLSKKVNGQSPNENHGIRLCTFVGSREQMILSVWSIKGEYSA